MERQKFTEMCCSNGFGSLTKKIKAQLHGHGKHFVNAVKFVNSYGAPHPHLIMPHISTSRTKISASLFQSIYIEPNLCRVYNDILLRLPSKKNYILLNCPKERPYHIPYCTFPYLSLHTFPHPFIPSHPIPFPISMPPYSPPEHPRSRNLPYPLNRPNSHQNRHKCPTRKSNGNGRTHIPRRLNRARPNNRPHLQQSHNPHHNRQNMHNSFRNTRHHTIGNAERRAISEGVYEVQGDGGDG